MEPATAVRQWRADCVTDCCSACVSRAPKCSRETTSVAKAAGLGPSRSCLARLRAGQLRGKSHRWVRYSYRASFLLSWRFLSRTACCTGTRNPVIASPCGLGYAQHPNDVSRGQTSPASVVCQEAKSCNSWPSFSLDWIPIQCRHYIWCICTVQDTIGSVLWTTLWKFGVLRVT